MSSCLPRPCGPVSTGSFHGRHNSIPLPIIKPAIAALCTQAHRKPCPTSDIRHRTYRRDLLTTGHRRENRQRADVRIYTSAAAGDAQKPQIWDLGDDRSASQAISASLFHAATDVPSFVRVLSLMKNLRHLRTTCEGQPPSHRYRRSVVDYALISLRIAVEQITLRCLDSLSLLSVHPAAVLYLQPKLGFGVSPASRKRWSQIRHLTIHMESFPYQAGSPTDHFKLLHAYLQSFPELRTLVFRWEGGRGLSPLSLAGEPCLQNAANKRLRRSDGRHGSQFLRPLRLPYLQELELVNVIMDAAQVASFVFDHRKSLHELNFQDIVLRTGTWDEALAPLTRKSDSARWKQYARHERSADVPIMLKPVATAQQSRPRESHPAQRQHQGLFELGE